MNIQVLSRKKFEEYAQGNHRIPSIVVSIRSHEESQVYIDKYQMQNANILNILPIEANDVDTIQHGGLTTQQAYQIIYFIRNNYNSDVKIIVHCGAGQSRSAGIAAAILKYYTNDDRIIFNNHKYTPNMLFYRQVLNAFIGA